MAALPLPTELPAVTTIRIGRLDLVTVNLISFIAPSFVYETRKMNRGSG